MQPGCLTIILIPGLLAAPLCHANNIPNEETLVANGAVIGEIVIERENVFDPTNPKENNWLYRFANRVHIVTRDKVVRTCFESSMTRICNDNWKIRII